MVVLVGHKVLRVLLEDPVVVAVVQQVMARVVPQHRVKVMRVVLVRIREITVVVAVEVLVPLVVMVVMGLVVMVVQVNSLEQEVLLRISGTSTVKVVGLRVAVVVGHKTLS